MSITIDQTGAPVTDATAPVGERAVDASRGRMDGTVSSQWFSRPDDQRFTSLDDLIASLQSRTDGVREEVIASSAIRLEGRRDNADALSLMAPDGEPVNPTNIAFRQMCGLVGAPYPYLTGKPGMIAAINLMHDFAANGRIDQKLYWNERTRDMRALTGPKYGRILDLALANSVRRFAGNGTGDTRWKVPGQIDWSRGTYNPYVDVTKETTTLYASDRDVFLFLVDDTHPIEVGKLPNGDPDLIFRGFYAWNSEVGTRSLGVSTFWLRAVCQNRNLWGVEDEGMETFRVIHSAMAPERFARELEPALLRYAASEPTRLRAGIAAAQDAKVAKTDEERRDFLAEKRWALPTKGIDAILATVEREEGHPAETVWDFVNGLTAVARTRTHTDERLDLERTAAKMMDAATRGRAVG